MKETLGPFLYGGLFSVGVPALLLLWARSTRDVVRLPVPDAPLAGLAVALAGGLLLGLGLWTLTRHGDGLPMNAYPTNRLVTRGVYALVPHPIYTGFTVLCLGVALATGSGSGLFLVTPMTALLCAALVLGYEAAQTERRLGARPRPIVALPADVPEPPSLPRRAGVLLLLMGPWLLVYEAFRFLGQPPDAVSSFLPFERRLPVCELAELAYLGTYPFVVLAPLLARRSDALRRFGIRGLLSMAIVFPLFLAAPLVAPPIPFEPEGPLGRLLALERSLDTPAAAFPSYHVVWAILAGELYAEGGRRARILGRLLAGLIAASCLLTGMHSLADVFAGALVGVLLARHEAVWAWLRRTAEHLACSFSERRFPPVRVLSHVAFSAAAGGVGALLAAVLAGRGGVPDVVVLTISSLLGGAIWAQLVEGSPYLLRPFGYNGAILGAVAGAFALAAAGHDPWLPLAAGAAGAPLTQAVGRLRCLVQGCCHGREAPEGIGIRHANPHSRPALLGLGDVPLHPTALYSILWNLPVSLVVLRLWSLGAALALVIGVYLLLAGLGRFVEESYRGEPQTPRVLGLPVYQWTAIASALAGILVSSFGSRSVPPAAELSGPALAAGAIGAVAWGIALSVDLPASTRRFSRLSG